MGIYGSENDVARFAFWLSAKANIVIKTSGVVITRIVVRKTSIVIMKISGRDTQWPFRFLEWLAV